MREDKPLAIAYFLILGMLMMSSISVAREDSIIKIRVSYKVILNPQKGTMPRVDGYGPFDRSLIEEGVRLANELLSSYWRGYRIQLDEVVEIGSLDASHPKPGHWFSTDFVQDTDGSAKLRDLHKAIKDNPAQFAWRHDAVNIYINQGTTGGKWNVPDLLVIGVDHVNLGWLQLHEICHHFGLYHTQGMQCGKSEAGQRNAPGDDRIADTVEDMQHWSRDDIAGNALSKDYEALTPLQKQMIDDVAENVMSYHFMPPINAELKRMTEGQLDRLSYAADRFASRRSTRDGKTIFVDSASTSDTGTHEWPFRTVWLAIAAANSAGGDIVLVRPGFYDETMTIDKPLTIRATRRGPVTIGLRANSDIY